MLDFLGKGHVAASEAPQLQSESWGAIVEQPLGLSAANFTQ